MNLLSIFWLESPFWSISHLQRNPNVNVTFAHCFVSQDRYSAALLKRVVLSMERGDILVMRGLDSIHGSLWHVMQASGDFWDEAEGNGSEKKTSENEKDSTVLLGIRMFMNQPTFGVVSHRRNYSHEGLVAALYIVTVPRSVIQACNRPGHTWHSIVKARSPDFRRCHSQVIYCICPSQLG